MGEQLFVALVFVLVFEPVFVLDAVLHAVVLLESLLMALVQVHSILRHLHLRLHSHHLVLQVRQYIPGHHLHFRRVLQVLYIEVVVFYHY